MKQQLLLASKHLKLRANGITILVCLLVNVLIGSSLFHVSPLASAQEPTLISPEIVVQAPLTVEINALRLKYRQELEKYRDIDRQSKIANEQYRQINTLQSLELAVTTLQRALLSRGKVLELYFTLLRFEVINTTGIEDAAKQQLVEKLDRAVIDISLNQAEINLATDRNRLDQVVAEFTPLGRTWESLAYESQAALTLGRLQSMFDQVSAIKNELEQSTATEVVTLKQGARDRAFAETETSLISVNTQLAEMLVSVQNTEQITSRNSLTYFLQQADRVYSQLAQSITFLEELTKL